VEFVSRRLKTWVERVDNVRMAALIQTAGQAKEKEGGKKIGKTSKSNVYSCRAEIWPVFH
jgi:hypothetical protein